MFSANLGKSYLVELILDTKSGKTFKKIEHHVQYAFGFKIEKKNVLNILDSLTR